MFSTHHQLNTIYPDTALGVHSTYLKLKSMIASKQLLGGDKIRYSWLCVRLQVDINTIKTALNLLKEEHLVLNIPKGGLIIRELSVPDIMEIFDCRIALETMAVKQFTLNASQEKIDDLRNLMAPFERGPVNAKVFQKINFHFHDIIMANCGNKFAYKLFGRGDFQFYMEHIGLLRPLDELLAEHLNIISAIHQRNEVAAVRLMRTHLTKSKLAFID